MTMEIIPFAKPFIGKEEEEAVLTVLRSGWLTTGNETLLFEKDFENFLKLKMEEDNKPLYCMAVNSATSGLHLALEACGIEKGDLVLLPSMTFTATAEVVRYLGAEVVFVDVSKDSYHMDPAALEDTLARLENGEAPYPPRKAGGNGFGPGGKPKALVPVHYGGLPCNMKAIIPIAEKYGLKIIEDAAHSFPSFIPDSNNPLNANTAAKGSWAGLMGNAGVFSFYATKTITSGEGGMIVTMDPSIAERVNIMRSHGIDRSIWNRYTDNKASWYYEVIAPGYKYNIPDILSAIGRVQLKRAGDLLSMRIKLSKIYDEAFSKSKDDPFIIPPTGAGDARHLYPLRLKPEKLTVNRDVFAEKMQEQGIGISVHFIPLHTMPYYKQRYSLEDGDFPETFKTYSQSISLPIWPGMTEQEINRVIDVVKAVSSEYTR
jgi:dTDP-4-amino-4,6-dideoxygalactose transaminase